MANRSSVISKAAEDPQFRQKLKSDPRGTLQRETGTPIPADVEITVLEETRDHAYIVLPRLKSEMSQEELAAAAGGAGVGCTNYVWTVYCTAE